MPGIASGRSDGTTRRTRTGSAAVVAMILAALAVTACAAPVPSPAIASEGLSLPGNAPWPEPPATPPACAGVGLDAILHGDPADPRITWLVDRAGGKRIDLSWPAGFRALFTPTLVVIDPSGRVVQREGDVIDGGCVDGDRILLGYP